MATLGRFEITSGFHVRDVNDPLRRVGINVTYERERLRNVAIDVSLWWFAWVVQCQVKPGGGK